MKTCRAILNRYYAKGDKTYVVAYALDKERQLVSKALLVPDTLRIGGYIKYGKPVTLVVEGDTLVSVMSDAEVAIRNALLADLEKPEEPAVEEPSTVVTDLRELL